MSPALYSKKSLSQSYISSGATSHTLLLSLERNRHYTCLPKANLALLFSVDWFLLDTEKLSPFTKFIKMCIIFFLNQISIKVT